jgi:hypothetical protein
MAGLPKSVLDISYRTSKALQPPLIHMKGISNFQNYLKRKDYHVSIYFILIQDGFVEKGERPLYGLRVPISSGHHLPPLDGESGFSLNLYFFENLNENFKFI